jgi:NitT/TauT family transport system ATP-binding protein
MTSSAPAGLLLDVAGVTLQYRAADRLIMATYRVSLQVYREDRFVVLGPSGCGKSTLLKSVAGFLAPAEGTITLNGVRVSEPAPTRMMVFQEFDQLLPWKTALQNIMFPMLKARRFPSAEIRDRARQALERVSLSRFADVYPHMLSGGMKQRVAIARAMAMEPEILLMDEPFASLDALTRRSMQAELLDLWRDVRFTLLFVTHSIEEAILLGSRILVLTPHPGRVRAELDCGQITGANADSDRFHALESRIHEMLFGNAPLAVEVSEHG